MACNGLFGTGDNGQINPPRSDSQFKLARAELVVLDRHVYALMTDLQILIDMVKVTHFSLMLRANFSWNQLSEWLNVQLETLHPGTLWGWYLQFWLVELVICGCLSIQCNSPINQSRSIEVGLRPSLPNQVSWLVILTVGLFSNTILDEYLSFLSSWEIRH